MLNTGDAAPGQTQTTCMAGLNVGTTSQATYVQTLQTNQKVCLFNVQPVPGYSDLYDTSVDREAERILTSSRKGAGSTRPAPLDVPGREPASIHLSSLGGITLKRLGILLVALFIAAVPAIAGPPNITVVNQTGIAVTATLSSSTSQSDALAGTGTWVPPAAPAATYTITFTRPSGPKLHLFKQLTASTQTVYLRHAGQVLQIVLSNDPPTK